MKPFRSIRWRHAAKSPAAMPGLDASLQTLDSFLNVSFQVTQEEQ
jgi:hypothetical protein